MIISFAVRNYKSIKNHVVLNFEVNSKDQTFASNFEIQSTDDSQKEITCLKTLGIWGANASGKSNLIHSLIDFHSLVINSSHYTLDDKIQEYKPFRLAEDSKNTPVYFEMDFILKGVRYLYSIEFLSDRIVAEELYRFGFRGKSFLFKRQNPTDDNPGVKRNPALLKGKASLVSCMKNQLFLSCAANSSAGIAILGEIYQYLSNHDFTDSAKIKHDLSKYYENTFYFKQLEAFITSIDVGVTKVEMKEDKFSSNSKVPVFYHGSSDEIFRLSDESEGTQCVYKMIPFYLMILERGYFYFIDEIEAHLHPAVVSLLIRLFHDPDINRKGAQLLFSSHALSLLDNDTMRRDQICFTRKDSDGITDLYALDEFKIRKEVDFYRWYQEGRFDALPDLQYDDLKQKIVAAFMEADREKK